tara:strand:- start:43478 stop:43987 length:510 start_codon:yes stop_codon:yes gene_type:complete
MRDNRVNIGFIRKPHGLRGYVRVEALSDSPDRFRNIERIGVELSDGSREYLKIESCRPEGNSWLMKFLEVDTSEKAERFRSAYIQVSEEDIATLPDDSYYVFEIEGCSVFSTEGELIGIVKEVISMPANDVLVVRMSKGEAMIPVAKNIIVEINPEDSKIIINLIPGLI